MNKILLIFSFVLSTLILFSCEPNRAENGDYLFGVKPIIPGSGSVGNNGNPKLLKKMTVVDADGAIGTFVYNYTAGVLTSANLDDDGEKSDFAFTYTDKKLSQFIITENDGSDFIKTTVNLVYNNGKLVSSSGNMESGGEELNKNKTTYTYNSAGKINKIETSITVKDSNDPTKNNEIFNYVSNISFMGENISTYKETLKTITPPPLTIDPIVLDIKLSEYDAKKNPLATLPFEFNLAAAHFLTSTNSVLGLSANNYGKAVIKSNTETLTANFTFIYDNEGYPISATSVQGNYKYEYQ